MASQLKSRSQASHAPGESGNQVEISNRDEFQNAVQSVHTGGNSINWILVNYNGSPNHIKLEASGSGGVNELESYLAEDKMSYAIVRVVDVVDNIPTDRYVYITWIGENVKGIEKARYGTNKTHITKLLGHYNVEIIASLKNEITEQEIMNKVQDASGSRNRTGEVTPKNVGGVGPTLTSAGSANPYGSRSGTSTVKIPSVNTSNSQQLQISDLESLKQILQDVKSPHTATNWMLLGYQGKNQLVLAGQGTGGLSELVSNLRSDQVNYGLVQVSDRIDNSVTTKVAQITWVGINVSPMFKGQTQTHKGVVDEFFTPVHTSLFAEVTNELTDEILNQKIQSLKGSSK